MHLSNSFCLLKCRLMGKANHNSSLHESHFRPEQQNFSSPEMLLPVHIVFESVFLSTSYPAQI